VYNRTEAGLFPEAPKRIDATKAKFGNVEAPTMAMSRKDALKRLKGLAPRIEEHLQKIANYPGSRDISHWTRETENWIRQMEDMLPHVGDKTAAEWADRITEWKARLGR
jgi:predicted flap endonuclease-1-like 5' DNA nuclease